MCFSFFSFHQVRDTGKYGKGVFALEDIPKGATVWEFKENDKLVGVVRFQLGIVSPFSILLILSEPDPVPNP